MEEVDVAGIGAGPSNLALITALLDVRERGETVPSTVFLERAGDFAWHPGSRLPGARIQVPFLKDLATQRNPRSRFTFLNYLYEAGRIEAFANLRELFPTRDEFADYLAWVATQSGPLIRYRCGATALVPLLRDGRCSRIGVVLDGAAEPAIAARAVVVGTGRAPFLPPIKGIDDPRVTHSSTLVPWWRARAGQTPPQRVLVVGGGQSAIESACYVLAANATASVSLCLRQPAPAAIDDNPFVNDWYTSERSSAFAALPASRRAHLLAGLAGSNFGVADRSLLEQLHRYGYEGRCHGVDRVVLLAERELTGIEPAEHMLHCRLRDVADGSTAMQAADAVILATGYAREEPPLLQGLHAWLCRDVDGRLRPDADYRLAAAPGFDAAVFMHGTREDCHGPAEGSLATRAVRAGVLFGALRRLLVAAP
ncbi:MAG: putative peptide monooxygenase [Rhodanobacteraceae bacterium]